MDVRDATKSLNQLERTQAKMASFRILKRDIQQTRKEMAEAKSAATKLGAEMARVERPTQRMQNEFRRAVRSSDDLERKFRDQHSRLSMLRGELSDVGVSTRNLADEERRLASETREANAHLNRQKDRLKAIRESAPLKHEEARAAIQADKELDERFERRRQRVQRGLSWTATVAGAATTAVGVDAVRGAATFESQLTGIAQKANLSRREVQAMGDIFLQNADRVAQMPEDQAAAMDVLAGKGIFNRFDQIADAQERFARIIRLTNDMMPPISRAATAYQADQDDLAGAVFAAQQSLKVRTDQTRRMIDIMAAGDDAGGFGMPDMGREFPALTAAYASMRREGIPAVMDLVAALEIVEKTAGSNSEAANNLRNVVNKVFSRETENNFKKFGINVREAMKKAVADGRPPLEALAELTNKALGGDLTKLSHLFGDEQAQSGMRALIMNYRELVDLRKKLGRSAGTADRAFATRMQDTASKAQREKAGLRASELRVGRQMNRGSNWLLDDAMPFIRRLFGADAASRRRNEQIRQRQSLLADLKTLIPGFGAGFDRAWFANARGKNAPKPPAARAPAKPPVAAPDPKVSDAAWRKALAQADAQNTALRQRAMTSQKEFQRIGRDSIIGFQQGMEAQYPALRARAQQMAASIPPIFRQELKIKSPSRVFMQIGSFVTEGLAIGIDRGQALPRRKMQALAAGMAASMALPAMASRSPFSLPAAVGSFARPAAAAGSAAAAQARYRHYEIHIHSAPGQNAQDIAAAVRAELDRRDRQAAADRRSSYRDDD